MASLLPQTFEVRTLGCQMNVHDSERMAGLLSEAGYVEAAKGEADIVVINTCAVRENADNKLYGNLGILAAQKRKNPRMRIAVAGCLAQKDRDTIIDKAPWVDTVVGTHNIDQLPTLLERANRTASPQIEIVETLETFPSDMPVRRGSAFSAWVAISVGCNNTCTFCIVPSLRGRERDRRPGEILAEVTALASQGVQEITLLGQNVNAYGVEFGQRTAFADLLRSVGAVPGIKRVRFTSPHPRDFSADVIAAMAQTPTVMPQLHMPLQSGSDRILKAMRRSYRAEKFLKIVGDVRTLIPDAAITTDIIIGFPGETDADFAATLAVVEQAQFASAFTFQYSPRPGTPAADYPEQVPSDVMAQRYRALAELQESISWQQNRTLVGGNLEVMVTGRGRKDAATARVSGRARDNRLVHVAAPALDLQPGDVVSAQITDAAPHHLLADGEVVLVQRYITEAGQSCQTGDMSNGGATDTKPVSLGLPGVGAPGPTPVA